MNLGLVLCPFAAGDAVLGLRVNKVQGLRFGVEILGLSLSLA